MKKTIFLFLLCMSCIFAHAQRLYDVFQSIPDSMISYLDASQRKELVSDIQAKEPAVLVNSIGDTTRIASHSSNYIRLKCNKARDMEIKLLPRKQEGDTIICVINTYKGPAEESIVDFYTLNWEKLNNDLFLNKVSEQSLISRPDSVSDDDFQQLCNTLDPLLINAHLSPNADTLTFSISLPDVPLEKKRQLEGLISQRKFNWTGEKFN